MNGGEWDYLDEKIHRAVSDVLDRAEQRDDPRVVEAYRTGAWLLRYGAIYLHRIDWLESADDSEADFLRRLRGDCADLGPPGAVPGSLMVVEDHLEQAGKLPGGPVIDGAPDRASAECVDCWDLWVVGANCSRHDHCGHCWIRSKAQRGSLCSGHRALAERDAANGTRTKKAIDSGPWRPILIGALLWGLVVAGLGALTIQDPARAPLWGVLGFAYYVGGCLLLPAVVERWRARGRS